MISGQPPPGLASSSRTERLLAPSVTIAFRLRRLRGRLDHHLAADREADAADPLRIDVRAALQERDRGVDVALALPAEEVGVALALALASTVEEQDAVAVPCQQLRTLLRGCPAGEGDHRCPVARRDVPAAEPQSVARRELHLLVRGAEVGGGNVGAGGVGDDVCDRDREEDGRPRGRACRAPGAAAANSATTAGRRAAATSRA